MVGEDAVTAGSIDEPIEGDTTATTVDRSDPVRSDGAEGGRRGRIVVWWVEFEGLYTNALDNVRTAGRSVTKEDFVELGPNLAISSALLGWLKESTYDIPSRVFRVMRDEAVDR